MRCISVHFLFYLFILGITVELSGQGFEQNLYDLQSADLITELDGNKLLINSALNQFHIIGSHGEVLENILHTNNHHPDDIHVGEALLDMHPHPMSNGDFVFFTRKLLDPDLGKSDLLYFNYRDGDSGTFTVQTTLFLPETLADIEETGYTSIEDYTFLNDHFYFSGIFQTTAAEQYPVLMKINLAGELVWAKTYLLPYSTNGQISRLRAIETTAANRILLGLEYADFEYYHLEVDEEGQETGGAYFPLMSDLSGLENAAQIAYWIQSDGGLVIAGRSTVAGDDEVFAFDSNAALLSSFDWFEGPVDVTQFYRVVRQVEGGFLVYYQDWVPVEGHRESITISKVDLAGSLVWIKTYIPNHYPEIRDFKVLDSGNIVLGAVLTAVGSPVPDFLGSFGYLLKLGPDGELYSSIFKGQTFEDIDPDCGQLVESPLGGWLVAYQSQLDTFYALSNALGAYERPLLPNTYEARLYPPSEYWASCPPVVGLDIMFADTLTHNFPAEAAVECPNLVVNTSAPFLRRCFDAVYTVNYCNTGTILAQDAYIEVELDPGLTYDSASLAPSFIEEQLLRFDLGTVDMGQCGEFQINVSVNCEDVLLGQTHCTTASIYPHTPCAIPLQWSGASLQAEARCEGDSVVFTVKNVGTNPTTETVRYIIIEDQVILLEGEGGTLAPGDSLVLSYPATGAMYRIEVEQEPNHPGNSFPTASIEACGGDSGAPISLGYITQYWEDDADYFVSIDCQQNIGSYDPNDKRAFPAGVAIGDKNYIEANQKITYHIRFQNTGTDTAFTVVVKDPIDAHLDITSLKLEAASHPYSLEITPLRELVFTFSEIKLVDSFRNEPLSHGFVSFSLDQIANLPEGTQIENQAAIFFDFNLPIYTNTWVHEIKEDILPHVIITDPPTVPPFRLIIGPNPMTEVSQMEVLDVLPKREIQLMIYDSRGVLHRQTKYQDSVFQFERKGLPAGIYFIEVMQDGKLIETAKMVIQT